MNTSVSNLATIFTEVAVREESVLQAACDKGIFFMPELAYTYVCGREAMTQAQKIFGDEVPEWNRELDLGNGGPSDLVFEFQNGKHIVIEFKMRDKIDAYIADLEKLSRLDANKNIRVFCVLLDMFTRDLPDDGRLQALQDAALMLGEKLTPLMSEFKTFETKQDRYQQPISCVVAVWCLEEIPDKPT